VGRAARAVVHSEAAGSDACSLQALARTVPTGAPHLPYPDDELSLKDEKSLAVPQRPKRFKLVCTC
jgi:hypothetical protein